MGNEFLAFDRMLLKSVNRWKSTFPVCICGDRIAPPPTKKIIPGRMTSSPCRSFECCAISILLSLPHYAARVSPWTRIKCMRPTLHRRNLKTYAAINGRFGFVFEENSVGEITWLSSRHRFWKSPFLWRISVNSIRRRNCVFKFLWCSVDAA